MGLIAASQRTFALAATAPRRLQNPDLVKQTATANPPPSSPLHANPVVGAQVDGRPTVVEPPAPSPVAQPAAATASSSGSSGNNSKPPPPPKKPKNRLRTFARTVLVTVVAGSGYILWRSYDQRHPGEQLPHDPKLPTVVVLGNGWASTAFLKELDNTGYNVVSPACLYSHTAAPHAFPNGTTGPVLQSRRKLTEPSDPQVVISPRNYFLFTPLLPSVTVGTLASRSILEPTRFLTRHLKRKTEVYEGEVYEVDPEKKTVRFIGELAGIAIRRGHPCPARALCSGAS